jgi:hypothetical protein
VCVIAELWKHARTALYRWPLDAGTGRNVEIPAFDQFHSLGTVVSTVIKRAERTPRCHVNKHIATARPCSLLQRQATDDGDVFQKRCEKALTSRPRMRCGKRLYSRSTNRDSNPLLTAPLTTMLGRRSFSHFLAQDETPTQMAYDGHRAWQSSPIAGFHLYNCAKVTLNWSSILPQESPPAMM